MQSSTTTPFRSNYFIRQYRIVKVIKADAIRHVSVAIYLKGLWFKKCVIKQAIEMRDRLARQFMLFQNFQGHLPVPEPLEMFEEEKETYIVLKFIEGRNLQDQIDSIYKGRDFASLLVTQKQKLMGCFLWVLRHVKKLHDMGYVHRDIAPGNFLVDRKDNIYLIDLELASPVGNTRGHDHFPGWTEGYSSPEQIANQKPCVQHDIYSLGALMFMTFTHHHPRILNKFTTCSLKDKLSPYNLPNYVIDVMHQCLHQNPRYRPALDDIIQCMKQLLQHVSRRNVKYVSDNRVSQKDIY